MFDLNMYYAALEVGHYLILAQGLVLLWENLMFFKMQKMLRNR